LPEANGKNESRKWKGQIAAENKNRTSFVTFKFDGKLVIKNTYKCIFYAFPSKLHFNYATHKEM
jgi:predicted RNA-binding protein associated with RNAse of E/G family